MIADNSPSFIWSQNRDQHVDSSGFASAVRSKKTEDFSTFDGEVDVVYRYQMFVKDFG
jgi:hypothetical protein